MKLMIGSIRKYFTATSVLVCLLISMLLFALPVAADRYSSSSYTIDASTMNSFGGSPTSSSYKLVSSGGETAIGNGASGSYKLAQGYVAQLEPLGGPSSLTLHVQPSGLVAYWPLDEGSGTTAYDASANSHDAAVSTGTVWSTGKLGGDLDTGSTGYAAAPDSTDFSSTSTMTVSLWANSPAIYPNTAMISHWDYTGFTPVSGSWAIQTTGGAGDGIRVFIAGYETDAGINYVDSAAGTWTSGVWNHIVIVYNGLLANASRVKIYVNGTSVSTTTNGTINNWLVNAVAPLTIGDFKGLNRYWRGGLDHIKIFNRSFSDAEVKAEYDAQNAGYPSGLNLSTITPGVSQTTTLDAITKASTTGYSLAISQNSNLTNGATTIPAVSGSIASPVAWSEGTTKGLGFTLVSGTGIPGAWNSGNSYAALPSSATTFYTRTGATANVKDVLGLRLRLDVATAQAAGNYNNLMTITGTTIP